MKSAVVNCLRDAVSRDCYWSHYLDQYVLPQTPTVSMHLGVFSEPYLNYIITGTKKVESRFSIRPCPPYKRVVAGDIVLLKRVGGPVVGVCRVSTVWYYDLVPGSLSQLRSEFSAVLCAQDPEFWAQRDDALFATLMQLEKVRAIEPFDVEKRDRRGWVVMRPRSQQLVLWDE